LEEKGGMSLFDEEWIVNRPSRLRTGLFPKVYMYSRFRTIMFT
jgi:hypothetical protein